MKENSSFVTPIQLIDLEPIPGRESILDIGGGGEGLVSRLEGQRVFAVDIRFDKIQEARLYDVHSQWILADARSICFQDASFNVASFWFSLGYFHSFKLKFAALAEAFRCMKEGGLLSIIAAKIANKEEKHVFNAHFVFPNGSISQIGFGVRGKQNQNVAIISQLVRSAGFKVIGSERHKYWFRIEALK